MDNDSDFFGEDQQTPIDATADITPSAEGYTDFGGDYVGGGYKGGGAEDYQQQQDAGQYGSLDGDEMNPAEDGSNGHMAFQGMPAPEEVADNALTRFMGEWEAKLKEKAQAEEAAKQQALQAARGDHDKFFAERELKKETRMNSNRTQEQVFLEQLESDLESENPWERIVSLVDTQAEPSGPFKDTSRIKTMIIQLKNDPIHASA
ncbi:clathrin light chain-domain-containing protein [Tribonema minus]|uniref:Clathrin light chain n=1 Tax=Tribonema minus TaxID=303371 RepID=A0A835YIR5_9STRA|nr:clathrin light chain-domain-containing protein [Tribonema minus]